MSGIIGGAGSRSGIVGETEIDYEEGSYSVTLSGHEGGTPTTTSGYGDLSYTKVGRLVTVMGSVGVDSVSGCSGRLTITLPFVPKASSSGTGYLGTCCPTQSVNISGDGEVVVLQLTDPGSVARAGFFALVDNSSVSDQLATGVYRISFSYEI